MIEQQDTKLSSFTAPVNDVAPAAEEALIADARAILTPADLVERKLISLLKNEPLPVSHLQTRYGRVGRSSRR